MKYRILAAVLFTLISTPSFAADTKPCEDMLKDLRTAMETTKPSDADKAKVKELEDKGIERCNADDDKRADEFFTAALAIVGK